MLAFLTLEGSRVAHVSSGGWERKGVLKNVMEWVDVRLQLPV